MTSSRDFVSPGQEWSPPRAELQNAWTRAAMLHAPNHSRLDRLNGRPRTLDILMISAALLDPFSVVGIGIPTLIPANEGSASEEPVFAHVAPVAGKWGIAYRGIDGGSFAAPVAVSGVTWARVNVTLTSDTHVDWDGSQLKSGSTGPARLLYAPSTGVQWCVILLDRDGGSTPSTGGGTNDCGCKTSQLLLDKGLITQDEFYALSCCESFTSCSMSSTGRLRNPVRMIVTGLVATGASGALSAAEAAAAVNWLNGRTVFMPLTTPNDGLAPSCSRSRVVMNPHPLILAVEYEAIGNNTNINIEVNVSFVNHAFAFQILVSQSAPIDGENGDYTIALAGNTFDGNGGTVISGTGASLRYITAAP